ncbi:MAG: M1 family metallopeptidase [Bacteroidia bacterium]|nr:M1 family metallopeptidase [Bacteroidia bacterium]
MNSWIQPFLLGLALSAAVPGFAQPGSTLPLLPEYEQALAAGTRNAGGTPGPRYFVNRTDYRIRARIEPASRKLGGSESLVYTNNSPDTLSQLVLRTYQDLYKRGAVRDENMPRAEQTEGMKISRIALNGAELPLTPGGPVSRRNTNLYIRLATPLPPGGQAALDIDWSFTISSGGRMRMGTYGEHAYFLAYWYPQMAVYDDLYGWDTIPYTGRVEFYNDFGDFDVRIDAPDGLLIWATGVWQNADSILSPAYLDRFRTAMRSDSVVRIVSEEDYNAEAPVTQPRERHSWHFKAEFVPDFAFAASDYYYWDAVSALVDTLTGRRTLAQAVYKPEALDFYEVAGFSKDILEDLSQRLPGIPYPYPSMTVFNGDLNSGGGMEYPMMVNNGSSNDAAAAYELAYHEIAHTYFPFYMGINERRFAFMDEGWASFFPVDPTRARGFAENPFSWSLPTYQNLSGTPMTKPLMDQSWKMEAMAYFNTAYSHPSLAYYVLKETLGDSLFKAALQTYMQRWNGKHPCPYDFFCTFNAVAGDLNWFWKPWFFENRRADLSLSGAGKLKGKKFSAQVENASGLPLPVVVTVYFKDGSSARIEQPATIWKSGARSIPVSGEYSKPITALELGDWYIPDANRGNNSIGR